MWNPRRAALRSVGMPGPEWMTPGGCPAPAHARGARRSWPAEFHAGDRPDFTEVPNSTVMPSLDSQPARAHGLAAYPGHIGVIPGRPRGFEPDSMKASGTRRALREEAAHGDLDELPEGGRPWGPPARPSPRRASLREAALAALLASGHGSRTRMFSNSLEHEAPGGEAREQRRGRERAQLDLRLAPRWTKNVTSPSSSASVSSRSSPKPQALLT